MKERGQEEKNIAPGLYEPDALEQEASEKEQRQGDTTPVTKLYLERTPED